jgi:hypothetical protein
MNSIMNNPDYRALCVELRQELASLYSDMSARIDFNGVYTERIDSLLDCARVALAKPEPEGVTDEDWRHELNGRLWDSYKTIGYQGEEFMYDSDFGIAFDAICDAVLQRYARPAIHPVPVAERPWEREGWCDAEGMCWWGHPSDDQTNAGWVPGTWEDVEMVGLDSFTISLPHHALPTPEANP